MVRRSTPERGPHSVEHGLAHEVTTEYSQPDANELGRRKYKLSLGREVPRAAAFDAERRQEDTDRSAVRCYVYENGRSLMVN